MAVRQYVGARYVPKFYQNSTDPSGTEWEGNRSYEALTVVSYNNDSYTSKIPVPAGIGNPASNPTYWARTGAYNAQVEQYRQEVVTAVSGVDEKLNQTTTKLEGDMQTLKSDTEQSVQQVQTQANEIQSNLTTEIEDRKKAVANVQQKLYKNFILISDSYGTVDGNFISILQPNYPNGHFSAIGGTGFGSSVYITDNWKSMLDNITVDDANSITAIYCIGGANDANLINDTRLTESTLNGFIDEFVNDATEKYPNATIYLSMVGWHITATISGYLTARECYIKAAERHSNVSYIYGIDLIFRNLMLIDPTNNIHPTKEGSQIFAKYLATVINTGCNNVDVEYYAEITDQFTVENGTIEVTNFYIHYHNSILTVSVIGNADSFLDIRYRLTEATDVDISKAIEMGRLPRLARSVNGNNVAYSTVNYTVGTSSATTEGYGTMELQKDNGRLLLRCRTKTTGAIQFLIASTQFIIDI